MGWMEFLFLFLGLAGLWIGSELTIHGALDIAERYKISRLFIGLTILALGTDLPELFIVITAALQRIQGIETSDLIIGETLGTTISQISLVLGVASLFGVLILTKRELLRDGLMMVGSVILLFIISSDGEITRADGIILFLVYVFYFISIFREEQIYDKIKRAPQIHFLWAVLSVISGFIILIIGSQWTVENALLVSERFGIEQYVIGILAVGLGTSLPELATSITALRKNAGTMAAGNILGSNIFDALFAIGVASAISGFTVRDELLFIDFPILIAVSLLVLVLFRRTMRMGKKEGSLLIAVYILYFIVRAIGIL